MYSWFQLFCFPCSPSNRINPLLGNQSQPVFTALGCCLAPPALSQGPTQSVQLKWKAEIPPPCQRSSHPGPPRHSWPLMETQVWVSRLISQVSASRGGCHPTLCPVALPKSPLILCLGLRHDLPAAFLTVFGPFCFATSFPWFPGHRPHWVFVFPLWSLLYGSSSSSNLFSSDFFILKIFKFTEKLKEQYS